jgi:hypothetical protein
MAAESWRLCFTCAHYIEVHEQPGGRCRAPECSCGQFVWNDAVECSCGHRIGVHVAKAGPPTNAWDEPGVRSWYRLVLRCASPGCTCQNFAE